MDGLSSTLDYEDRVYIPYRIEILDDTQYMVYYLEHVKDKLQFLTNKTFVNSGKYQGALNFKERERTFLFYEMTHQEDEFVSSDQEYVWKVTPYEILYTREVSGVRIHSDCVELFKLVPTLSLIEEHEVPVVAYIGVGESDIKEQILLQTKNEKVGIFGKGYYFNNYENALYDAYYKEETDDYMVRLENTSHLNDRVIQNDQVQIKGTSFYHGTHYLGEVSECNRNVKYFIYYYDDEVIYLKSHKPHDCKKEIQLRKESGYVMRYILFLKKHSIQKTGSNADSYAADSIYMVKNTDHFICLSYHFIKKK